MVGTVAYMPPEQALGRQPDARSDLYSLGCVLYEMVTGRPPFLGDDAVAIISQHINTAPVAPTWHNPEVPRALEALILRCWPRTPTSGPRAPPRCRRRLARRWRRQRTVAAAAGRGGGEPAGPAGRRRLRRPRAGDGRAAGRPGGRALRPRAGCCCWSASRGSARPAPREELATYARSARRAGALGPLLRGGGRARLLALGADDARLRPRPRPAGAAVRAGARRRRHRPGRLGGARAAARAARAAGAGAGAGALPAVRRHHHLPEERRRSASRWCWCWTTCTGRTSRRCCCCSSWRASCAGARLLVLGTYRDVEVRRQHPLSQTLGELSRERLEPAHPAAGPDASDDVARFIEMTAGVRAARGAGRGGLPGDGGQPVLRHRGRAAAGRRGAAGEPART